MRNHKQNNRGKKRFEILLIVLYWFFVVFMLSLIIHLFIIQIIDPGKYRAKARAQRISRTFVMRGNIYDRNGIKLATDKVYLDVYAHPASYDSTPEELAKKLSPILDMPYNELVAKLKKKDPVINIKKDIDKVTAKKIAELHLREISMGKKNTRTYPQGSMAAHILGYYNFDADIATGIEYTQKDKLEHVEHTTRYQRSRDGRIIYDFLTDPVAITTNPKGEDVTLTIDAAIQHVAERELFKMASSRKADGGVAIVMNPKNGEILAYAVYPTFDPNHYNKVSQKNLKNWSLTDVYPPGSTFKTITVASALETGKISADTKVLDTCQMAVADYTIKNSHCYPKGMISITDLFERSSNVASYNLAKLMTSREFYDQIKKFGFGQKTGIDLPGESSGLLNSPSHWDGATKATMSYGYGTSVSAMQMVSAVGALANGGVKVTPHIIKYSPEEAEKRIKYTQVVSPETARIVTDALVASVDKGKTTFKMDKYKLAAKTGTSNKPNPRGGWFTNMSYASTIGYLPASDPQILIYVCVDNAKGSEVWGNTIAGPVFHEIAEETARILNLRPDKVQPVKKKEIK